MRRFLIDTDTASDDAVALVMALRAPDVQVEAITVVAGNVPVEQGVQNALYTVELCEKNVPVYQGAAEPLFCTLETAQQVHGNDGLGDIGLPLHGRTPAPGHAVDVLREVINRYPGEITLVTLGPLTNVALALLIEPSLAGKVKECIVMGGTNAGGLGNVTPVAEYNIWVDPEAAKIVFSSPMPTTMVSWNASESFARLSMQEMQDLRNVGTPFAHFCIDIQTVRPASSLVGREEPCLSLPDPLAMAVALDPQSVISALHQAVTVETKGEYTRGQTVVDAQHRTELEPRTNVVVTASHERFVAMLHEAVAR
jgi:purine nucleosidase